MPQYARAKVIDIRGTSFNNMGYTTKRSGAPHKSLELLPEEALYLVERGSMLCWREFPFLSSDVDEDNDPIKLRGEPMTVQRCFVDMLGIEGVTIEHYQVREPKHKS
jgi:tRNA-splicing endonuclease subunit Sen54